MTIPSQASIYRGRCRD